MWFVYMAVMLWKWVCLHGSYLLVAVTILLKDLGEECGPELIMNGLKMCMKTEHLVYLDSISFLPCALRKLPEALDLSASKSWYPHYFNTEEI